MVHEPKFGNFYGKSKINIVTFLTPQVTTHSPSLITAGPIAMCLTDRDQFSANHDAKSSLALCPFSVPAPTEDKLH